MPIPLRPPRSFVPLPVVVTLALLAFVAPNATAQGPGAGFGGGGGFGRGGGGRGGGQQNVPGIPLPAGVPLGLRTSAPVPADNALTPEKVAVGRLLFFDPILSLDRTVSCSSCHQPTHGFGDTTSVSMGIEGRLGTRNSPTLLNRVFGQRFFWNGRAATLEEAVLMPVQDTMEMSLTLPEMVKRVSADRRYSTLLASAFPGAAITDTTIARAIASYVRTLWTGDSPYDRSQAGDSTALGAPARRGQALFFGRADCSNCHRGSNFTDEQFHALGVSPSQPGAFKTPTLRNVALTGPYMHDGSLRTLEQVVEFYDRGGNDPAAAQGQGRGRGGRRIRPLGLTSDERADLVAFLRALTGPSVEALPSRSASR
jgi:cytochrome c peroxidase